MYQLTKKKIEEISTLIKWMEVNENNVMVTLIESERHQNNPKRVYKVFSACDDNLHFVISKEDETYDIKQIAGIETNGRYHNSDTLHHIILRLYNMVLKRFDNLMEVNKELEEAIEMFRVND